MKRVALVLLLLVYPATASAAWRPPETVQAGQRGASITPEVGIDDAGNATVVWSRVREIFPRPGGDVIKRPTFRAAVFAADADADADGTVGPAQRLTPRGENADSAHVFVAPDGHAALIWSQGPPRGVRTKKPRNVQLVTRDPGGDWSAPKTISEPGRNYASDVTIEPDGTIAVAYTTLRAGGGDLHLRRFTPAGTMVSDEQPGRGTGAKLAASATFPHAVMTYLRGNTRTDRDTYLYANGTEFAIGKTTYWRPQIAAGDRIAVAWSRSLEDDQAAMLTQIAPDGTREEQHLSTPDSVALEPVVDARGDRAASAWYFSIPPNSTATYDVRYSHPGVEAEDVTPAPAHGSSTSVALSATQTIGVWSIDPAGRAQLVGAAADDGGPFGTPQRISRAEELYASSDDPPLAVDADGDGVLAYLATNGPKDHHAHLSVTTLKG